MRFAGPDVVLFVTGALLLSGSVYGLVQMDEFPPGDSAFGVYRIEWMESTESLAAATFDSEDSVPFEFDVEGAGVTHLLVTVSCDHTPAVPDSASARISVSLQGPNGQTGDGEGECGTPVQVDIPIATAEEGVVDAASAEEAEAYALENLIGNEAAGTWSGEVTFSPANPFTAFVDYSGSVDAEITRAVPSATGITR